MARRSRPNVDMGLPWAAASASATPCVTSTSPLPGAPSLASTSIASLASTSTAPAVDAAAGPAAAPASETQTETQILNWVSDPLDLTVSPHGEEVSLHHVYPHGQVASPHHLSRFHVRALLVPQDGGGGVVDGADGAPSASGIVRVGGGAAGMAGGGSGVERDRGKGKASGSARGLRHGNATPHTMHHNLVSPSKLDSGLHDSCLDDSDLEQGAASGSRGTCATPSAVAGGGGGGASATRGGASATGSRGGASVAGAYSGAAGACKAVAGGSAFANGIVSRTTPSRHSASGPLSVAAAPDSSPFEPASLARRQSTPGNHVAAHTAGASVQDTSCSTVGGTGQVLDGLCQREECSLQRFQRLFPAGISARLVAHTVGRRASESALSSSIIHMYHRLLGERQELAAAERQEPAP